MPVNCARFSFNAAGVRPRSICERSLAFFRRQRPSTRGSGSTAKALSHGRATPEPLTTTRAFARYEADR